jgi:hypothetical protein
MIRSIALAAAALLAAGTASATDNTSLTFQGVTFETQALDSDTLQLTITDALKASGDWTGIAFLKSFEIKNIGNVASASLSGWSATVDHGLNANGCAAGNTLGACFTKTPALALSNSMTFSIDFVAVANTTLNFSSPHLKVEFLSSLTGGKVGSLLSQDLPPVQAVPEPQTYALMLAGLGAIGFIARRRRQQG